MKGCQFLLKPPCCYLAETVTCVCSLLVGATLFQGIEWSTDLRGALPEDLGLKWISNRALFVLSLIYFAVEVTGVPSAKVHDSSIEVYVICIPLATEPSKLRWQYDIYGLEG